jgi:hypothetical protein
MELEYYLRRGRGSSLGPNSGLHRPSDGNKAIVMTRMKREKRKRRKEEEEMARMLKPCSPVTPMRLVGLSRTDCYDVTGGHTMDCGWVTTRPLVAQ